LTLGIVTDTGQAGNRQRRRAGDRRAKEAQGHDQEATEDSPGQLGELAPTA
jgi:hypothetical protein